MVFLKLSELVQYIPKMALIALVPIGMTVIFGLLLRFTAFKHLKYPVIQAIIGVCFGVAAILGTEYGVDVGGAMINVRDAAPLCAGLFFGGPAGIIAGIIGGVERWFAVYWGVGAYTQIACSISTLLAGFYAAGLRKYMFEGRKASPIRGFTVGAIMEVFHMVMVFLTNIATADKAFTVVQICSIPMILLNGLSVFLASFLLSLMNSDHRLMDPSRHSVAEKMQSRLLLAVVIGYCVTVTLLFSSQTGLSVSEITGLLKTTLEDTQNDITQAADNMMLKIAHQVTHETQLEASTGQLQELCRQYGLDEINLVNEDAVITGSSKEELIGFDMNSGAQSGEFNGLLHGVEEYVQSARSITFDNSVSMKYAGVAVNGGYVQVGYTKEKAEAEIKSEVESMTINRHIGESGFVAVVDRAGRVISESKQEISTDLLEDELYAYLKALPDDEYTMFNLLLDGEEQYAMYTTRSGYYIFALAPISEVNRARNMELYLTTFIEILIFAVLYALLYFLTNGLVVRNIRKVNSSLAQITAGNLEEKVDVRQSAEFSELSDGINQTVDALKGYIAEAESRMEKDLELAKSIQLSALPSIFPPFPNRTEIDLHASMDTAREVGGDFYDFYWLDENHLAILIADVSGKGIPAAMFMMSAKTMLKNYATTGIPVNEIFTGANNSLCENNDAGMFVTAWMGILDVQTGHMEFANAGHNPPLLRRPGQPFAYMRSRPGFILAGMEGVRYKLQEIDLEPGSTIYLYTDGVTEATDAKEELYGEERLLDCLNRHADGTMRELCDAVTQDLDAFVAQAPQFDDITMVALRLHHKTN